MTIETAIAALKDALGDRISTSRADREFHGRSETHFPDRPADAVAFPESTEEVSRIVRICADHGCPIIAWGTGTSLEAHAVPVRGGVSLDMMRMNRVLAIHPEDMDVVVQPGVTREDLNAELRATGLFFPVDPGANASLGGMAATRASGTTAVRYGTMRENVLSMEVVLADGRIIRTGSRARKSSAGYDLTHLMIGSEGTLGIITEMTLRLQGQPEAISAAICDFPDISAAVDTVIETIQMAIPVARIEFVDELTARAFNIYAKADLPERPHLFLEFHGSENAVREQAETVGEIVRSHGGGDFRWSTKAEERTALWKMRHNAFYAQKSLKPESDAIATDICVPISRLAEAVTETRADIEASGLLGPMLGHVGDGNFHCTFLLTPGAEAEKRAAKDLLHRLSLRALDMGGTVTGEHGVGIGKLGYMQQEHGEAWSVMSEIKRALDPDNILNPGKLVALN
ncbi:FAD-binding oxidoreductase [Oceanomicrobium pacificus]|uniref:D-lactate dehydrogenase (cytochrome) n=1 Tax=Oceanomicrobium pacificus TaxID=2692916 RepID=A0A6B0TV16_9RHOB|nr:FAD-linked oxidase C-terminal domain-containing protein [Oceanomicrobium pacificus]MXU65438.1 FAD-binding protein [Oceanomicrobium pacificus]